MLFRRVALIWLAAHIFIEALFALCPHTAGFWHYVPHALLVPVRIYGAFTGATGSYGFFSPDISPELRARFFETTPAGEREVVLFGPMNHEAALRVGDLLDAQWDVGTSKANMEKNRALAASFAGKVLELRPGASAVTVVVEHYQLPRIAQGHQPEPPWREMYRAQFQRVQK